MPREQCKNRAREKTLGTVRENFSPLHHLAALLRARVTPVTQKKIILAARAVIRSGPLGFLR